MTLLTLTIVSVLVAATLYFWLKTGDNSLRAQGLKRLALGVPFLVLAFLIGSLFGAYVALVFAADVFWQILTGRPGVDSGGYADRLWDWKDTNTRYILVGEGSFRFFP
jgi:hypothetical protein